MNSKKSSQFLLDLEKQTKKLLQQVGLESPPDSSDESESESFSSSSDSCEVLDSKDSKGVSNSNKNNMSGPGKKTKSNVPLNPSKTEQKNEVQDLKRLIMEMTKTVS